MVMKSAISGIAEKRKNARQGGPQNQILNGPANSRKLILEAINRNCKETRSEKRVAAHYSEEGVSS